MCAVPVYVSLTSIASNEDVLLTTLRSLLSQSVTPDKIYLFLSEEPYLLDRGFKGRRLRNGVLAQLLHHAPLISVIWVENDGPYRKLLPLLKEKWEEDCIIITVDDDSAYDKHLVKNLLEDHKTHNCAVAFRGMSPTLSWIGEFNYSRRNWDSYTPSSKVDESGASRCALHNFPMGKGGILYKPSFFHKTGGLIFSRELYRSTCPTQDDVWFYVVRVLNGVPCYLGAREWGRDTPGPGGGLFKHYNSRNDANTRAGARAIAGIQRTGLRFARPH